MSAQHMKQLIRRRIIAERAQLSANQRASYSTVITERLLQLPEYRQANAVLGYMNFGAEYESWLWVEKVLAQGKRLALPRVNQHTNHLDLYWVENLENQLTAGLWGIREPVVKRCERIAMLNELDFILLPGVAFGRDGARLGYGKGYYDRLLANHANAALAAAAFSMQIIEGIPQEATDRKVQWLVTEIETISAL